MVRDETQAQSRLRRIAYALDSGELARPDRSFLVGALLLIADGLESPARALGLDVKPLMSAKRIRQASAARLLQVKTCTIAERDDYAEFLRGFGVTDAVAGKPQTKRDALLDIGEQLFGARTRANAVRARNAAAAGRKIIKHRGKPGRPRAR